MKYALLASAAVKAFANANSASKLFVSSDPVGDTDLLLADYEALNWVEVAGVGSRGEMGKTTNILTYDTWDSVVVQKAKGMTDAGTVSLELARKPTDPGQLILRAAGAVGNNNNYAFLERRADGTTKTNGTHIYNRGLVGGPTRPGGRNEDFDLEVFTLGLQQEEIVVNPGAGGAAPVNTVLPAITGTAEVGETLNLSNGTFTGDAVITYEYQWFAGGVAISGANGNTFELTSAQLGKIIQARVTARNAVGHASAYSGATAAVTA